MPERDSVIDNDNAARAAALIAALNLMAEALTRADSVGPLFTCSEADALAQVLALSGHVEEAATFLVRHARGDDEVDFDWHHGVTSPERARDYIRDYFAVAVAEPVQARHPARAAHLALHPVNPASAPAPSPQQASTGGRTADVVARAPGPPSAGTERLSPSPGSRPRS